MAVTFPTLDQIDPAQAWQPWQPTAADPWGRKWAAHLYRRAAFGPSREDLLEAERLGLEGTLDLLLRGQARCRGGPGDPDRRRPHRRRARRRRRAAPRLVALLHAPGRPPAPREDDPVLAQPLRHQHRQGAGPGPDVPPELPAAPARPGPVRPVPAGDQPDAAMLVWLDSNSNVKGKPNENYARELMELFSLGVGHYTEKDIREAARAFTGWRTDGDGLRVRRPLARRRRQDRPGPDRQLGRRRRGAHRAASSRRRPGSWSASSTASSSARRPLRPTALLEPLCESFRKSDYDIAALVRTILASRHFYSGHAFRQRIKGPVEYVLGAVQAVYRRYGEEEADYRPLPQQVLVGRLEAMGQQLFAPPNVKGWPGGRSWLNTSTVLERDNFAEALAMGTLWHRPVAGAGRPRRRPPARARGRLLAQIARARHSPTRPRSRRRRGPSTRPGCCKRRA